MNTGKILLVMVATLFAAGCAAAPITSYTLFADPHFSPQDLELISRAAEAWEVYTDVTIRVVVDSCAGKAWTSGMLCIAPAFQHTITCGDGVGRGGCTDQYGDSAYTVVAISPAAESRPDYLLWLFTHEMGHELGLEHTPAGVMRPDFVEGSVITCVDVNQFDAVRGLRQAQGCE